MILKNINVYKSPYNYFDVLGNNENALSKAFAYLISVDKDCFFCFLKQLGIKIQNSNYNFSKFKIDIQKKDPLV